MLWRKCSCTDGGRGRCAYICARVFVKSETFLVAKPILKKTCWPSMTVKAFRLSKRKESMRLSTHHAVACIVYTLHTHHIRQLDVWIALSLLALCSPIQTLTQTQHTCSVQSSFDQLWGTDSFCHFHFHDDRCHFTHLSVYLNWNLLRTNYDGALARRAMIGTPIYLGGF